MEWRDAEYDAYSKTEQWAIARGLPETHPGFRKKDAHGNEVTDEAAIHRLVDREYPGVTAKPSSGKKPEQVIGKDPATGKTLVKRGDGTTYSPPPKKGDSFSADNSITDPPGGIKIDINQLQCP